MVNLIHHAKAQKNTHAKLRRARLRVQNQCSTPRNKTKVMVRVGKVCLRWFVSWFLSNFICHCSFVILIHLQIIQWLDELRDALNQINRRLEELTEEVNILKQVTQNNIDEEPVVAEKKKTRGGRISVRISVSNTYHDSMSILEYWFLLVLHSFPFVSI